MKLPVVSACATATLLVSTVSANGFVATLVRLDGNTTSPTSKFQVAAQGNYCKVGQNLDFFGGDYMNVRGGQDVCCQACRDNACEAYTWTDYEGGMCWLKNKVLTPKIRIGAKGCIRGAFGSQAARFENCDMPGNDLTQFRIGDATQCEFNCWTIDACKAATWTSFEGGTCYYKSAVTECVYKQGASTGVVLNEGRYNGW